MPQLQDAVAQASDLLSLLRPATTDPCLIEMETCFRAQPQGGEWLRRPASRSVARYTRKRRKRPYTDGEVNRLIDALLHPLLRLDAGFLIVDGIAHGLVERDPAKSFVKFIRYNLPGLVAQLKRSEKSNKRSREKMRP